ncbi:MAG TPA: cupin domain-containing protein [bacterium]|nr:cupin domain-containing protein [bacterium]
MAKEPVIRKEQGYTVADMGPLDLLHEYTITSSAGETFSGKVWLKNRIGLTGTEISYGALPPGAKVPFAHRHHQNEELYIFLSGEGEMRLDDSSVAVKEGTIVKVDPPVWRGMRNTGTVPLVHLVIQAKAGSLEQSNQHDSEYRPLG